MGLTASQELERKNDEHVKFLTKRICNKDGSKPYVFISYKSDDWKTVLGDIVYKLVKEHGLNVYFDGDFSGHNPLWTDQFPENMESGNCRGVVAFIDDAYTKSYATLMELLYSQVNCQEEKPPYSRVKKPVIPVYIGKLSNILDESNTGLGVDTYENNEVNIHADQEVKLFNELFDKAVEAKILDKTIKPYKKSQKNNNGLSKELCATMCREVLGYVNANDNVYGVGVTINDIVSTIKDVCGEEVVSDITANTDKAVKDNDAYKIIIDEENIKKNTINTIKESKTVSEHVENSPLTDGYNYTIFGKSYTAGSREQGKLMFDAFEALVSRYPECAESLTKRTSIAKAVDVRAAGTKDAYPTYFRICKSFIIDGSEYLVGTSYGFDAKLAEIKGMFKICGINPGEFILDGKPLAEKGAAVKETVVINSVAKQNIEQKLDIQTSDKKYVSSEVDCAEEKSSQFKYTLWGIEHTSASLANMMHDVFDLIAEKYSSRIPEMADNNSITSVARKVDVDKEILPPNKLNYFKAKKEHIVDGISYYVSTRYNREQGIAQLEKMLVLCEGSVNAFVITAKPEKVTHN